MFRLPVKVSTDAMLMIFFLSGLGGVGDASQCLARERARMKDAVKLTWMTFAFHVG